jgi:hypothetical protein
MDRGNQQHHWIERKYQRVGADLPCELCFPEDGSAPARILNLSAGGLKFSCGHDTFFRVLPEDQRTPGQVTGVEIGIRFQFQSGHQAPTSLQLNVRVVHTERLAQDKFHVGVMFIDLDESVARILENYIEECRKLQQA